MAFQLGGKIRHNHLHGGHSGRQHRLWLVQGAGLRAQPRAQGGRTPDLSDWRAVTWAPCCPWVVGERRMGKLKPLSLAFWIGFSLLKKSFSLNVFFLNENRRSHKAAGRRSTPAWSMSFTYVKGSRTVAHACPPPAVVTQGFLGDSPADSLRDCLWPLRPCGGGTDRDQQRPHVLDPKIGTPDPKILPHGPLQRKCVDP